MLNLSASVILSKIIILNKQVIIATKTPKVTRGNSRLRIMQAHVKHLKRIFNLIANSSGEYNRLKELKFRQIRI